MYKITIGWLHWSYKDHKYKQIRSAKGQLGGTFDHSFPKNASYNDILDIALTRFYPKGRSKKGRRCHMLARLGNSKGVEITNSDTFHLGEYLHGCMTQKVRIYLLTKPQVMLPYNYFYDNCKIITM